MYRSACQALAFESEAVGREMTVTEDVIKTCWGPKSHHSTDAACFSSSFHSVVLEYFKTWLSGFHS